MAHSPSEPAHAPSEPAHAPSKPAHAPSEPAQPRRAGVGLVLEARGRGPSFVAELAPGGSADRSGQVRVGDQLLRVDGQIIQGLTPADLSQIISGPEGTSVRLSFRRITSNFFSEDEDNFELTLVRCVPQMLDVTCIRGPAEAPQVYPLQSQRGGCAGTNYGSLGIAFTVEKQKITVEKQQVIVKSIKSNSPAAFDGDLKVGDVVVRIDNRPVATTEAGLKAQELGEPGKTVTLTIERKGFLGIEQRKVVIRRPRGPKSLKGAERGSKDDNQGFMESAAYAAGFQTFTCHVCSACGIEGESLSGN